MNSDFENKISQEMMSTDSATSGSERHIHPRTRTLIACAALATLILAISWGMFHRADSLAFSGDKAQGVDSLSTAWGTEARSLSPQSALAHGVEKPALSYADLPLRFEQNQAQASESARFVAAGRGYRVSLLPQAALLDFIPPDHSKHSRHVRSGRTAHSKPKPGTSVAHGAPDRTVEQSHLSLRVVGGNPDAQMQGLEPMGSAIFYYEGNDPNQWRKHVPTYGKVKYQDLYPGIDLVYYGNQDQLEYDFVVAPGKNPSQIRLDVAGARKLRFDEGGNLILATEEGELLLRKPHVYQMSGEIRQEITGNFSLQGTRVGFVVGAYDSSRALVIDPTLNYAAYVGRSVNDKVNGIALGSDGSTYVSGIAPAMTPSVQNEAFVAHISADGKTLLYMTYLGGSATTEARGLAVDAAGYAYITGFTQATDFPVQGALQPSCSLDAKEVCEGQAFITKLNPGGSLNFSTFLGGGGTDAGNAITLDAAGNIYVAGSTTSTNFPIVHATQVSSAGKGDAFVAKIAGDGSQVVYATYLGGSGADEALGIAVDGNASVYVTGQTESVDFPTENPLQALCALNSSNQCAGEAFVTKLTSDGSSLVYSTYLGGSGGDSGNAIAVDAAGNAYLAGATSSQDFPLLSPLQKQAKGTTQAFIAKVRPDGTALVYSTYLGGSGTDLATSIAVDKFGHAFVSGQTDSADFPTMKPVQADCYKNTGGTCSQDAFLAVLSSGGSTLRFSTYLGGSGIDEGRGIALDSKGNAYMGGASTSGDFPMATPVAVTSKSSVLNASGTSSAATSGSSSSNGTPLSVPSGGGVVAMLSGLPDQAPQAACTGSINWVGTAGDNKWTTVTNWDKGVLPVSTDTVCIGTAFSSATITIDSLTSTANQTITSLVSNASITFTTGPLTVSDGAEFVNALSITGGTLTLSGTAGSSVGTTMTLSGTLTGSDTLTVTGAVAWSGGTMSGSGITNLQGSTTLTNEPALDTRTLNNSGTVSTSDTLPMLVYSGAQINNLKGAIWNLTTDAGIAQETTPNGAFNNAGTFEKTSGTGSSSITVPFNNNTGATVSANAATLSFSNISSAVGGFSVATGDALSLGSSGTYALTGPITGSGTAVVTFTAGTANITDTYNVAGTTTVTGGTANFNTGTTLTNVGAVKVTGGTLNFSTGSTVTTPSLTLSGTLTGSDTLTVTGAVAWSGGTMSGSGITNLQGSTTLTNEPALDTRTLNNSGTVSTSDTLPMLVYSGAQINNLKGAIWNLTTDAGIAQETTPNGAFNNAGTFEKTSGTGSSSITVPFNNNTGATVSANAATLSFSNISSAVGGFSVATGDALSLGSSGTYALTGPITGSGTAVVTFTAGTANITDTYNVAGTTTVTGGTANFNTGTTLTNVGAVKVTGGTLNFSTGSTVTTPSLTLSGTLTGSDTLTVTGAVAWSGGTMSGSGITNLQGSTTLTNEPALDTRTLNNSGTVSTSDTLPMLVYSGAQINNLKGAIWNLTTDAGIAQETTPNGAFNNAGTFEKTSGTGSSSITVPFNNNTGATVSANAATLSFSNISSAVGGFSVATGDALSLGSSGTYALTGPITGSGTAVVTFTAGTANITDTYNVAGTTTVTGGTANFNTGTTLTNVGAVKVTGGTLNFSTGSTVTTPSLTLSGTLTGSDTLTVTGAAAWSGGTMSGSGITNLQGSTTLTNEPALDTRTLNNSGTVSTSDTLPMLVYSGAQINNLKGAIWNLTTDAGIAQETTPNGAFNNAGTFEKTSGTGSSSITVPFNNNTGATVSANAATLSFSSTYTQTAGNTFLNGGSIATSNPLSIQGGTLTGSGTITATGSANAISNTGGTISPGVSTTVGTIAVGTSTTASYSQGSAAAYSVKIGGTSAGQFDTLSTTGSATLAGTLNVSLINSFSPALSNTFTILTAGSVSGTFGTTNLPALSSGLGWKVTYNATSVVLSVVSVSSPVVTLPTTSLTFPNTIVGTSSPVNRTAVLENTGTAPLIITSIAPTGADAGNYSYSTDATQPCPISPATLGNGSSCVLDVTFTPLSAGTHNNAQLTITDNNGNVVGSTQTISLAGTGIQLTSIAVTPNPSTVPMGSKIQFTATGTYSDNSTQNLTNTATWNSSNTAVAIISNTSGTQGLATGVTGGTSNITAVQGSITSTPVDVLTVTTATHFSVSAPGVATENTPFNFTVTALDQNNNTVPGYSGTVHFTSTDSQASLPANSTLTSGSGTFPATLKTAGSQTITATDTVTTTITGISNAISVSTGTAASITATSGTPQSAAINTAFAAALVATVKDSGGNPVQGVTVTFTAPASGASGSFAGGMNTATTNSSGVATSAVFTANATAGSYTVAATVAGVTTSASFALTNTAGTAASITATSGTPQSAAINTAFAAALVATVKDSGGNPVQGVTVTFTAPASGASGSFAGGVNTATTNASGVATSAVFTANGTAGSYTVAATVAGVTTSASFALTNTAGTAASITATSGTPQSAAINTAFAAALVATVKDSGGNPVQGVTVTFTAPASGASGSFAGEQHGDDERQRGSHFGGVHGQRRLRAVTR